MALNPPGFAIVPTYLPEGSGGSKMGSRRNIVYILLSICVVLFFPRSPRSTGGRYIINPRPDGGARVKNNKRPPPSTFLPKAKKNEMAYRHQTLHTLPCINFTHPDQRIFLRL